MINSMKIIYLYKIAIMIGAVSTMVGCGGSSADKSSTSEVESVISDQNNGGTSVKVQAQNTTQENPNQKYEDNLSIQNCNNDWCGKHYGRMRW